MATQPLSAAPEADTPRTLGAILLGAARGWDRFWFRPADPTTLGLIRIAAGLIVLYVHLVYTFDLQQLFGEHAWVDARAINLLRKQMPIAPMADSFEQRPLEPLPAPQTDAKARDIEEYQRTWGVDPRRVQAQGYAVSSIWYHLTDPTWMAVVHGLILVVMLLFTLGFCTRITSALTWIAALSYIQRAPTTLFGQDTMMNIVLLYLMIGPSGAALSLDRVLGRWWARRRAALEHRPAPAWQPPAPSVLANLALRLLQVHFCIIYLASGTSKLLGPAWWNGTALWLTLANYEFSPLDWPVYYSFLKFLSHHRWLWELFCTGGVLFTLALEIGLPFLIWRRETRWLMIIGSVVMHTGISMSMGLTTFSLMMLAMLCSFVPAPAVKGLLRALPLVRKHSTEPAPALAA
jgi:hypothetical protein